MVHNSGNFLEVAAQVALEKLTGVLWSAARTESDKPLLPFPNELQPSDLSTDSSDYLIPLGLSSNSPIKAGNAPDW